jgi:hypothetical protein
MGFGCGDDNKFNDSACFYSSYRDNLLYFGELSMAKISFVHIYAMVCAQYRINRQLDQELAIERTNKEQHI